MVGWNYFADDRPPGADAGVADRVDPLPGAHRKYLDRAEHRLGHGPVLDPRADGRGVDGLAAASRDHPHRRIPRLPVSGVAPAVPSVLEQSLQGATYAVEFGVRQLTGICLLAAGGKRDKDRP